MQPGDLVEVDFGVPLGSEPGFVRPAVVVTAGLVLEARPRTFHVVPVTSSVDRQWPTDVPVSGPTLDSVAQVHLLIVVPVEALTGTTYGNVGAIALAQVRDVVIDMLDLAV